MQTLFDILIPILGPGVGGVFLLACAFWYLFAREYVARQRRQTDIADEPIDFDKWVEEPYEWFIEKLKNGLPTALRPETVADNPKPKGILKSLEWMWELRAKDDAHVQRLARTPWSWPLIDLALRLAIAYPVLLATLVWALGGPDTIGGFPFFPSDPPRWLKPATLVYLVFIMILVFVNLAVQQGVFERLATRLVLLAGAFASAGAIAVAVAGAVAGAFAFAVAGAFGFAVAGAFEFAGAVAFAGVFALAGAVAFAGAVAVAYFTRKDRSFGAAWLDPGILAYFALITLGLTVGFFALPYYPDDTKVLVVILLLLPLTNAIFDWLSYGTTLRLLEYGWTQRETPGKSHWVWLSGLADFFIALLLFFALSAAVFWILFAANAVTDTQLFAIASILDQIEEDH